MGWPRASLSLLAALSALLLKGEASSSSSSSSHSMRYFSTGVSELGQGLPKYIAVGYVDGQLFVQYDSNTRRMESRAPWMEKVAEEDPQYWDTQTQLSRGAEETFRVDVETVRNYYNLSKGFHSVQGMYGCELRPDGSKGGYKQYAYDGRDYISLDKETLTWTAADVPAQNTKRKWEGEPAYAQRQKAYLEEICIEWLQRYLEYGKETLLRTEERHEAAYWDQFLQLWIMADRPDPAHLFPAGAGPARHVGQRRGPARQQQEPEQRGDQEAQPREVQQHEIEGGEAQNDPQAEEGGEERPEGKVTRQAGFDDRESLVCQAYGFYPKEIEVTWRKGGEVLHEDTFHRNTAPYPDGTYHAWLSISIDPKDRDQYRCHVGHTSLAEPLVLAWEEPASNLGLIVGGVAATVLLIGAGTAGSCVYRKCQGGSKAAPKKHQGGYEAASMSDGGSNSSSRGSDPPTV